MKNKINPMKIVGLLLICITFVSFSQTEDHNSTAAEEYNKNLSLLFILINNVGFFKQACEEEFPEYSEVNQISFDAWAAEHKNFHDDIQALVDDIMLQQADSSGSELMEVRKEFNDQLAEGQRQILDLLKKTIAEEGGDFKTWCSKYPNYTQSAMTDIQIKFGDKVASMYAAKALMDAEKSIPRNVISINKSTDLGKMTVGDLIMLLNAKMPFPKGGETIEEILALLHSTDHKVIEQTASMLLVQGFKQSEDTQDKKAAFQVEYHFDKGIYIKGPIIKDTSTQDLEK